MAVMGAMTSNEPNMVHLYPNLSTSRPVNASPTIWPTLVICFRIVCFPALSGQSLSPILSPEYCMGQKVPGLCTHSMLYEPEGRRSPYFFANSGNPNSEPMSE